VVSAAAGSPDAFSFFASRATRPGLTNAAATLAADDSVAGRSFFTIVATAFSTALFVTETFASKQDPLRQTSSGLSRSCSKSGWSLLLLNGHVEQGPTIRLSGGNSASICQGAIFSDRSRPATSARIRWTFPWQMPSSWTRL
jgi:hypothetical protein